MNNKLYMTLVDSIADDIKSGRTAPHTKLPSKRQMCILRGVSQSTVETAYGILAAEGYIYSVPQKGYFACDLIQLPASAAKNKTIPTEETAQTEPQRQFFCRLSTSDTDTSVFPFSTWAKLTKDTVYNNPGLLSRGDSRGDIELRRELCAFLHSYRGVDCREEQIVVGAGMDYLLDVIIRLLPAETVFGTENPGYRAAAAVFESNGRKTVPVSVDKYGMNITDLERSGANVAYVTPSHQFPLCITMPVSRRTQLLDWANRADGRYIIEDDYDSEFRYAYRPVPAMQGMDSEGKVIYIGTFSRSLAPSIRLAYMVLPFDLCRAYAGVSKYMSSTVSRFEQHTLCSFIAGGYYMRHLRRAGNLYRQKQALLREKLNEIPHLTVHGDEAGLHFLIHIDGMSEEDIVSRAADAGIAVTGLSKYWTGSGCPDSVAIIGFAGPSIETLDLAAVRLKEAWRRR